MYYILGYHPHGVWGSMGGAAGRQRGLSHDVSTIFDGWIQIKKSDSFTPSFPRKTSHFPIGSGNRPVCR